MRIFVTHAAMFAWERKGIAVLRRGTAVKDCRQRHGFAGNAQLARIPLRLACSCGRPPNAHGLTHCKQALRGQALEGIQHRKGFMARRPIRQGHACTAATKCVTPRGASAPPSQCPMNGGPRATGVACKTRSSGAQVLSSARFRVGPCLHQSLPRGSCLRRQFPKAVVEGCFFGQGGGAQSRAGQPNVCQRIEHAIVGETGVQGALLSRPAHLRKGTCLNAVRNAGAFVPRARAHLSGRIGAHAGKGCPFVGAGLRKCCCVAVPPKPHMVKWLQASKQTHAWL